MRMNRIAGQSVLGCILGLGAGFIVGCDSNATSDTVVTDTGTSADAEGDATLAPDGSANDPDAPEPDVHADVAVENDVPDGDACVVITTECQVRDSEVVGGDSIVASVGAYVDCVAEYDGSDLGAERQWRWRLEGPGLAMSPGYDVNQASVSLLVQQPGDFTMRAELLDAGRVVSCEPAITTVVGNTDADLLVVLTWALADSAEPRWEGNVLYDLNLHVVRRASDDSCWGAIPDDCHWRNRTPDWGEEGVALDDPRLFQFGDDAPSGPRLVSLNSLEAFDYSIGVDHWDQGFPNDVNVLVDIYLHGTLISSLTHVLPAAGGFWYAADLQWPSGGLSVRDEAYETIADANDAEE